MGVPSISYTDTLRHSTGRGIFVISVSSINPVIKSQDNHGTKVHRWR